MCDIVWVLLGLVLTADFKFFLLFENNKKIIYAIKLFAHLCRNRCSLGTFGKTLGQERTAIGNNSFVFRPRSLHRSFTVRLYGAWMVLRLVGEH